MKCLERSWLVIVLVVGASTGLVGCASSPATGPAVAPVAPSTSEVHQSPADHAVSASLELLHQEVTRAIPRLRGQGIIVAENHPDVRTGREDIWILNLTPAKETVLDHEFGPKRITLSSTWEIPCTCVAKPSGTPPLITPR